MPCKHEIDFVLHEPRLVHHSHAFTFHVMVVVAVVPWGVHQNDQPWRLAPVHLGELRFKPLVLRGVFSWEKATDLSTHLQLWYWLICKYAADSTLVYAVLAKTWSQKNRTYRMRSMMPGQWYMLRLFWWNNSKVPCYRKTYRVCDTCCCMAWMATFRPANTCDVLF